MTTDYIYVIMMNFNETDCLNCSIYFHNNYININRHEALAGCIIFHLLNAVSNYE